MTRKTPTPDPDGRKDRLRHRAAHAMFGLLVAAFVVVVGLPFAGLHVASLAWLAPTPGPGVGNYRALRDEDMAALAAFAGAVWAEPDAMPSKGRLGRFLGQPSGGVYVALREHGHRLAAVWNGDGTIGTSLAAAIRRARHVAGLDGVAGENVVLEVDIAHDYRRVNDPASSPLLASSSLGVLGLEITRGNVREKLAPTYMLSTNRSYAGFIKLFRDKYGIDKGDFARTARLRVFEADQVLVSLAPSSARLMTRGNRLVDQAEVTGPTLKQAVKLGAEWLIDNVQSDGRMVYMYWPSAGRESGGNNMIRQWMATLAMEQVAARISDRSMWSLIARNIRYNLDHFYREEDGLGLIDYRGQVSLGSVALAALALREHPGRQRWEKQEAALERTVASLWNQDGSFRTFYEPKGRNDEQNYYPGEAMLLWATVIAETHDRALLDKYHEILPLLPRLASRSREPQPGLRSLADRGGGRHLAHDQGQGSAELRLRDERLALEDAAGPGRRALARNGRPVLRPASSLRPAPCLGRRGLSRRPGRCLPARGRGQGRAAPEPLSRRHESGPPPRSPASIRRRYGHVLRA